MAVLNQLTKKLVTNNKYNAWILFLGWTRPAPLSISCWFRFSARVKESSYEITKRRKWDSGGYRITTDLTSKTSTFLEENFGSRAAVNVSCANKEDSPFGIRRFYLLVLRLRVVNYDRPIFFFHFLSKSRNNSTHFFAGSGVESWRKLHFQLAWRVQTMIVQSWTSQMYFEDEILSLFLVHQSSLRSDAEYAKKSISALLTLLMHVLTFLRRNFQAN